MAEYNVTLVIKYDKVSNCYDVYERFYGPESDKLFYIGFCAEDYTVNDVKRFIRTSKRRFKKCKIVVEK